MEEGRRSLKPRMINTVASILYHLRLGKIFALRSDAILNYVICSRFILSIG